MTLVFQMTATESKEFEADTIEVADHCVLISGDDPSGYEGPKQPVAVIHLAPGQFVYVKRDVESKA